jgi:glycerate kinase
VEDAAMTSAPVPERPVLVAPAAFAGRFRAAEVAGHLGRGLERAGLMPPDLCPVADGGPGTLDALLPVLGGELVGVRDLEGRPAQFALIEGGGTAIVEADDGRAAGALICAAAEAGAAVIVVAAAGAAEDALWAIEEHGGARGARILALGGGDGLAAALATLPGARLEAAGPWILDALGFDARMRAARAVLTGEGRLDAGTLRGRVVGEIGTRARQAGVPLHAVVGRDDMDRFEKRIIDLQVVREAGTAAELVAAGEALGRALATGAA